MERRQKIVEEANKRVERWSKVVEEANKSGPNFSKVQNFGKGSKLKTWETENEETDFRFAIYDL